MKKRLIGIERPGVWPFAHVVPEESRRHVGDEDVELAARVDVEERPLAGRRVRVERRVGRVRERLRRRALDAGEDLVPDAVRPAVERAVADQVLLLRAVDDGAGELRVGDEAAAGERPEPSSSPSASCAPLTCTRRIGAACDAAQNSPELAAALAPRR